MERGAIHRLAASYATPATRTAVRTLLALEAQLAKFVFSASEPILAQMRLAWWRDRFAQVPASWPVGNAVLDDLADWGPYAARLSSLVDGWEALLAEAPLSEGAYDAYVAGRSAGWMALAHKEGVAVAPDAVTSAASRWALADCAAAIANQSSADLARELGRSLPKGGALPRALRPLAVLDIIAARSLASGAEPMSRPGDLVAVLRRGLVGR